MNDFIAGKKITVVMYHYVRNLAKTRYPKIKGLDIKKFVKQLEYLDQYHTIITVQDCLQYLEGSKKDFPKNSALLTFDDGYIEHYTEVFPLLDERGIQGAFFPPVQSTMEGKVLDVNKIHFILALSDEPKKLLTILESEIKNLQSQFSLKDPEHYFKNVQSSEHPYDPIEIIKFKRVLQRDLPLEARKVIVSYLFDKFVGVKEDVFAHELYMNEDQLKSLIRNGMFVGGHGYSHRWLNAISTQEKRIESQKTKAFLGHLGVEDDELTMCYPYGGYDEELISILKGDEYMAGFTTQPDKALLVEEKRFELSRIDTNELGINKS